MFDGAGIPLRQGDSEALEAMSDARLRRKVRELSVLFEISQMLDGSLDLKKVLGPALVHMGRELGMQRASLTLLNREAQQIVTEETYGVSETDRDRGRFQIGEGVTGQVVASGQPKVIERVGQSADFLNRTGPDSRGADDNLSFVCVPIKLKTEVVGTLSADRVWTDDGALDDDLRVMTIVASMIAQAVKLRQEAEEEQERLVEENARLQQRLQDRFQPDNMIGRSKPMLEVFDHVRQVAQTATTVLILGESGTGKELIANAVHFASPRADGPFIKVNCGALPENLVESELFGHEKGAYTGAHTQRKGRFERADGGTIFLDEVGDLPLAMQVKLLRVLQEKQFERVGGTRTLDVDVRVLAATSRDLSERMAAGEFRRDLFYRLNVFPIRVPPLRERKSDIMLLADHFVERYNEVHEANVRRISTPAIDMLLSYHWPGNVRELENCIERAALLSQDGVIHSHHLPPSLQTAESSDTEFSGSLDEALDTLERELILDALKSTRGNMAAAARKLKVTERIMGLRVDKYEIDPQRFK